MLLKLINSDGNGSAKGVFFMPRNAKFCGLLALACSAAWAGGRDKLSHELASVASNSQAKVIVQWKTAPDDAKHQKVKNHGGQLHSTLESIKAGVYSVPGSSLNALSNDPDVLYISADRPLRGAL